ncbi:pre-mRNA 3' end processing protein WDR33 [Exaiptasia diaphana]|nr:pre-mRNA 3' end processing protein WDR33 [Exaiptasia diaphana]
MFQSSPQGAPKVGPKPGMQNAVEANPSDEQRMYVNRQPLVFDGKRMRKPVARKTIDYNSSVVRYLENRKWFKSLNSRHTIQPDESYATEAHDLPVRSMVWSHNDSWLLSGDHGGVVKYWQSNMNNVQMYEAHKEPIRGLRYLSLHTQRSSRFDARRHGYLSRWRSNREGDYMGHIIYEVEPASRPT